MKLRHAVRSIFLFLLAAPVTHAALLWTCGVDDNAWPTTGTGGGPAANFWQEAGINALPGNPASPQGNGLSDDDYYFAGTYTSIIPLNGTYTPVGTVAANEGGAERAFAGSDNTKRYHFNVPASYGPNDRVSVTFDALNLDTSAADPRYGVEIYINGTLVRPQEVIRVPQFDIDYTSPQKKLSEVGIVTGPGTDNIVMLKGISYSGTGGGAWLGFDYVKMEIDNSPLLVNTFTVNDPLLRPGESATLAWTLAEPGATLSINQGIGDVTGQTSVVVAPGVDTVYTLTATLGALTQTKTVTVATTLWNAAFEAGKDDASAAEFSHEDAADDNYYFAGNYTSAGGPNQAANEVLNDDTNTDTIAGRTGSPAIGFERSVTELDPVMNVWFIPPPATLLPEARIRITADVVSVSGTNTLEFSINGNVLRNQGFISSPSLVQFEVTGLTSTLASGPNRLTIRRTGSTIGGSTTFDYVMIDTLPGTLPVITGITDDNILGTHTVNWTAASGKTYRVQKSADSGVTWVELIQGFPSGGSPGAALFYEDRVTPFTDPRPAYRVLLE